MLTYLFQVKELKYSIKNQIHLSMSCEPLLHDQTENRMTVVVLKMIQ